MALSASPMLAGPYSDDLAKCLVESSSTADKIDLARWVFVALAAHPSVRELSKASDQDRDQICERAGQLFTRLLTKDCRDQAAKALRYEQSTALESSFQVLGQVAMQELMTNEGVNGVLEELGKHMDSKKLEELARAQSAPAAQQ